MCTKTDRGAKSDLGAKSARTQTYLLCACTASTALNVQILPSFTTPVNSGSANDVMFSLFPISTENE